MKKKKTLLILIFAFFGAATIHISTAQTYDPLAVQRINNLIAYNGLNATPNEPESWGFVTWDDQTPMQIRMLYLHEKNLTGNATFTGLTALEGMQINDNNLTDINLTNCINLSFLNCNNNNLSKLDLTNCKGISDLWCSNNGISKIFLTTCTKLLLLVCDNNNLSEIDISNCKELRILDCKNNNLSTIDLSNCRELNALDCNNNNLFEIDLAGLNDLTYFSGVSQTVSFTLYENETGEYTREISLNNPTFENSAISYSNGILKSTDNTIDSTSFTIQTNKSGYELSGTIYFNYSTIGINSQEKVSLKVYPNPVKNILFVECGNFYTIKLYDISGKEVISRNAQDKTEINTNHLNNGIYSVYILSEGKVIGSCKIVKN